MSPQGDSEFPDIRIQGIRKYRGARGVTYTVRWVVGGAPHQRTFSTFKLAETFRSKLHIAARAGAAFSVDTGLQKALGAPSAGITWYSHACEFIDHKWAHASPRHRKALAEALTDLTVVLLEPGSRPRDLVALRRVLFSWSFNSSARTQEAPKEGETALRWVQGHSLPLERLREARTLRTGLDAISRKQDGSLAAAATTQRKRSAFFSVLQFAVELEYFEANPLAKISWKRPPTTHALDRRVVVNIDQARALLAAVSDQMPAVEAFFACLYFAGLRPAEAVNLRAADCALPEAGWGELVLSGSYQISGAAWTRSGKSGDEQALKHRSAKDTRIVPAHPELVETLRRHIEQFGVGAQGRMFVTRTGKAGVPLSPPYSNPLSMGTAYRVWSRARAATLTPEQLASPLARRPYDLRHACLSTWLNAGVPATQVAEWAGHSVNVLLKVYAKCIDGQDEAAKQRIEQALKPLE